MAAAKTSKYLIIILITVAIAVAGLTLAAITVNQSVSSTGTITAGPNVGIYSNSACTNAITSISWGSIEVGNSATYTFYIEDTGGAQMAPSITIGAISPSAAVGYVTMTSPTSLPSEIQPGASNAIAVTLTVTVSSSTPTSVTSFSNTITISGTG